MKSCIFMLFLNFFLPAALVSNHRGFWKSRNIPIFTIYGYNVSQSMCSGHILSTYYVYFWVRILKSWPCVKFLLISRKAAPDLSFWTKKVLSFCPKGKNWVFLALEFLQKCWKKKPGLCFILPENIMTRNKMLSRISGLRFLRCAKVSNIALTCSIRPESALSLLLLSSLPCFRTSAMARSSDRPLASLDRNLKWTLLDV